MNSQNQWLSYKKAAITMCFVTLGALLYAIVIKPLFTDGSWGEVAGAELASKGLGYAIAAGIVFLLWCLIIAIRKK
ncbi:hypothetical protein [Corynebacterium propinquum]